MVRWLILVCLATSCLLALGGYYYDVSNYPPYIDFDSATLGIFVNNLSFQSHYDYFPSHAHIPQVEYRKAWAAQFLPVSIPLSWLQRIFGLAWWDVDNLLRTCGLVFGFLGSVCTARLLRRQDGYSYVDGIFLLAFLAVTPPFLLFLRTEVPHFMLAFLLFWLSVLLMARFVTSGSTKYLYLLTPVLAYYALAPYPPLVCLPFIFLLLLWRRGMLRLSLVGAPMVLALILLIGTWLGLVVLISHTYEPSLGAYLTKVSQFLSARSGAIAATNLDITLLDDKLQKLLNQHLLFLRDGLGDQSRGDDLWTLGTLHIVWLLAFPIGLYGLFRQLRQSDETGWVFFAVLLVCFVFAFTVSFPEGRYLMVVLPCYAFYIHAGIRQLLRGELQRLVAMTALILLTTINTVYLVTGDYNDYMQLKFYQQAGTRDAVRILQEEYRQQGYIGLALPSVGALGPLNFHLYANFKLFFTDRAGLAKMIAKRETDPAQDLLHRLLVLRNKLHTEDIDICRANGFRVVREFTEGVSGQSFVLLALASLPPKAEDDANSEVQWRDHSAPSRL